MPDVRVRSCGRANCPVLIIHGENDRVVPFEQAQAIYDAVRQPKRLIVVRGAGHGRPVSDGGRYLIELARFFLNGR